MVSKLLMGAIVHDLHVVSPPFERSNPLGPMDGSENALEFGVEKKKKIGVRNQVDEHETVGVDSFPYPSRPNGLHDDADAVRSTHAHG